jgi:flagellin-like hook-associated protein FlgL
LQRINELGVQGLNATNSPSDRIAIAVEMEGLNQQLLGYANTKNANGEYLFSGFRSDTQPFSKMVDTIVAGKDMTAAAAVAQTGTITINGVATAPITTTAAGPGSGLLSRAAVVSAINALNLPPNPTGVTAIDTNLDSGGVRLVAADGRNIAVQFTGTLDSASTGVLAAAPAAAGPLIYVRAYNYAGDANQRPIQIGSDRQIADGDYGSSVFGVPKGPLPATVPVPGAITNIFEAIDKFATDLRANAPNSASLDDISSGSDKMLTVQSSVGTRLNALDSQEGNNADFALNMKTVLAATEDLDYAEAISRFNLQTVSLQAAQQAFAQVKKLSLFNYL